MGDYDFEEGQEQIENLQRIIDGLKHNLNVIEGELRQIDEKECSKQAWDRISLALEFAEQ